MSADQQSNGIHRLLYISRSSDAMTDAALTAKEIAAASEPKNRAKGVTGGLVAHASWFIQVLEGPYDVIMDLYSEIARDTRHRDVQLVSIKATEARTFDKWGMRAGEMKPSDFELLFDPSKMSEQTLLGLVRLAVLGFGKAKAT